MSQDVVPAPDEEPQALLSEHAVLSRLSTLLSAELDGEIVLYNETSDAIHLLDPRAAVVWVSLDGSAPLSRVAAEIAQAYAAPVEQVLDDVRATVARFASLGLIADGC